MKKYDTLLEEQKDLLFKYIFSFADDGMGLKVAINEEISRMKKIVAENKSAIPELADRFESLGVMLESFSKQSIDDKMLLKVMKTQEFCKELI